MSTSPVQIPSLTPTFAPTATSLVAPMPVPNVDPTDATSVPLLLRDVPANLPAYDRDDCRHWIDADGDCLNTRNEVLLEEAIGTPTFAATNQCLVGSGQWLGLFTGTTQEQQ